MTRRRWGAVLLAIGLTWLVGYPLLITVGEAVGLPGHLSFAAFGEFVHRPDEWLALGHSLFIAVASVILAGALGIPLAFLFERAEFPGRKLLGALVVLPVALPPLVGVIAFLFLYGESGFVARAVEAIFGLDHSPWQLSGAWAILLVHAYSMYVYFYLFVRAGLAAADASLKEAAESLGAGPVRSFFKVTIPQLKPALAGAGLLTLMTALASFSAPYIFGGGYRVMTTQIVASRLNGDVTMAQVEAVVLALVAAAGLWGMAKLDPSWQTTAGHGLAPVRRRRLQGSNRFLAAAAAWLLALFLLLPHATLLLVSLVPAGTWTSQALPPVLSGANYKAVVQAAERLRPMVNSLWMAVAATAGAVALGFAAAALASRVKGLLGRWLESLLVVPWAIPGTVFALALATTFSVNEPWFGRFVLVGTAFILPLAYMVRSLPLTGRSTLAGMRQLDPALGEAASSLGARGWMVLRRVTVPLLAPAILAGASLAFVTSLGDFVTSILLYTYSTRPISIEINSNLRLQETGVAAVYGVLLMIVSAIFLYWGRSESRQ